MAMGLLEVSTLTSAARVSEKHNSNVPLFLNRILGLKVERQTLVSNSTSQLPNCKFSSLLEI